MWLRSRKLKYFVLDHWPKLLLAAVVIAGVLWFARALVIAMEFDR